MSTNINPFRDEFLISDVDDDRGIPFGAERLGYATQNRRESGVGDVWGEHADQTRRPRPHSCRRYSSSHFHHRSMLSRCASPAAPGS